VVFYAI